MNRDRENLKQRTETESREVQITVTERRLPKDMLNNLRHKADLEELTTGETLHSKYSASD